MRGRQQHNISPNSNHPELEYAYAQDSVEPSESVNNNILDQAFIIYSDEDMMSLSSQSHNESLSFDSKSVALSHRSYVSQRSNKPKSEYSNGQLLGNFANEESSIYDVRESQCSQSGKELLHQLEPLFKNKNFLRRSPRFATYDQSSNCEQQSVIQKPFKFKKTNTQLSPRQTCMIEDEKSPLNQITQILQQKQEQHMLLNNTTSSNLNDQKLLESESLFGPQIFPSVRQTRSSKKLNSYESESTYSNNSRQNGPESTNQYLSKVTKDYIMTARKEKKIRKAQKEKASNNGTQRGRHSHLRHN